MKEQDDIQSLQCIAIIVWGILLLDDLLAFDNKALIRIRYWLICSHMCIDVGKRADEADCGVQVFSS